MPVSTPNVIEEIYIVFDINRKVANIANTNIVRSWFDFSPTRLLYKAIRG